jgi:hypothetical protein
MAHRPRLTEAFKDGRLRHEPRGTLAHLAWLDERCVTDGPDREPTEMGLHFRAKGSAASCAPDEALAKERSFSGGQVMFTAAAFHA